MSLILQDLLVRFENLSLREQVLVGITVAGMTMFLLQVCFIDPLFTEGKTIKKKILASKVLNDGYQRQLGHDSASDDDKKIAQIQFEVDETKAQIEALDVEVNKFISRMVPAQEMPKLLQIVLNQNSLQLVALENTPPTPIVVEPDDNGLEHKVRSNQLFHHGMTIKVRGDYHSILSYIRELEDQKWKLNWRSMIYEVGIYPMGEVEIKVETLSQEKRWLGV